MIVDLFAGGGGWLRALQQLGLQDHGYEIDKDAAATYAAAGGTVTRCDLRTLKPEGSPEGLVGSPPCQPYSKAGKQEGRDGAGGRLPLICAEWALTLLPRWVALEQVPGAASMFTRVAALLSSRYNVAMYELHTEQYGVPQKRIRVILMAHIDGKPSKPTPTHSRYYPHQPSRLDPGVQQWVTMEHALGWEGRVGFPRAGDALGKVTAEGYRERDLHPTNQPAPAVTGKARSWVRERPAPTIVGSYRPHIVAKPSYRHSHPRQDEPGSVEITPQEAAILQGFPPDWPWQGSRTSRFQQIGNAIPPPLAKAVITTLQEM